MPTATVEDYLKRIYMLEQQRPGDLVTMGLLAQATEVAPGTATAMVKRLDGAGLVTYEPYGGVRLTPEGLRLALDVLRRHRLIESFLVEILGLDWSEVHEEAERLEHAISDKLLDRIDQRLGHPEFDPHGDPIPDSAGAVRATKTTPIVECPPGAPARIARVLAQDEPFLRFAAEHGLRPGATVRVEAVDEIGQTVTLRADDHEALTLGRSAAAKLLVETP